MSKEESVIADQRKQVDEKREMVEGDEERCDTRF